jgi:hypothetical protein
LENALNDARHLACERNNIIGLQSAAEPWVEVRTIQIGGTYRVVTSTWGENKKETADRQTLHKQERRVMLLKNGNKSPNGTEDGWEMVQEFTWQSCQYSNSGNAFDNKGFYPGLRTVTIKVAQ